MATATRRRIRYHCIVCSSECEKKVFVALTAVVGHTSIAWDQKTFHFLGECAGFGIALWSLWGRFSLWPFWIVAVLVCGSFGCMPR